MTNKIYRLLASEDKQNILIGLNLAAIAEGNKRLRTFCRKYIVKAKPIEIDEFKIRLAACFLHGMPGSSAMTVETADGILDIYIPHGKRVIEQLPNLYIDNWQHLYLNYPKHSPLYTKYPTKYSRRVLFENIEKKSQCSGDWNIIEHLKKSPFDMIVTHTIKYLAKVKTIQNGKRKTVTKIVSLNQYKSLHWRSLKKLTDPLKAEFSAIIKASNIPPLKWMELRLEHNINFDLDNLAGTIKIFVDCLRSEGVINEDNKKYWDYLSIKYNPEIEKNYITFSITGEIVV